MDRLSVVSWVLVLGGIMVGCGTSSPRTRIVPKSQKVVTGEVDVAAGQAVNYRIEIQPEMLEPTLTGTFNARGGTGNDITAAIADDTNYTNWINGHQAEVIWKTAGQQTAGRFELKLQPGIYFLGISNKFSTVSDKKVELDVNLKYQQKEAATGG